MGKLGIVCSQFPEQHETFVIQELGALHQAGLNMRIYSLKHCHDDIIHPESLPLIDITTYLAWNDLVLLPKSLIGLIKRPIKALKALGWVLKNECWSMMSLAKGLVIWYQSLAIADQMRKDQVTHIHAHWATMPTSCAVILQILLDLPFSFTAHAWDIFVKNGSLHEKVKRSEMIITCTDYNRIHLQTVCPQNADKIFLNYHGVNTDKFDASERCCSKDKPLFLSVGRHVEQKGYPDMIQAYALLKQAGIDFEAVIVGKGPLLEEHTALIEKNNLNGCVALKGNMPQTELKELYRRANAFVLPCVIASNQDRDGIPNVILEAIAMGLPVVSTTVSGVPEAVISEETGKLVSPHAPEELFKALKELIENIDKQQTMGQKARHLAEEKFAAKDHMKALVEKMQSLLDREN